MSLIKLTIEVDMEILRSISRLIESLPTFLGDILNQGLYRSPKDNVHNQCISCLLVPYSHQLFYIHSSTSNGQSTITRGYHVVMASALLMTVNPTF